MGWTRDRREDVARSRLGARLVVVANREPCIDRFRDGGVEVVRPTGKATVGWAITPDGTPFPGRYPPTPPLPNPT